MLRDSPAPGTLRALVARVAAGMVPRQITELVVTSPVLVLATLFALQLALRVPLAVLPPWATTLNALSGAAAVAVGILALWGVLRTGRLQLAWMGAAIISLGLAVVLAYLAGTPISLDTSAQMQNLGAALAGVLHLTGTVFAFFTADLSRNRMRRRVAVLAVALGCGLAATVWVCYQSMSQHLPVFFAPGQGGTPLRQAVVAISALLYAVAALLSLTNYARTRSLFLYVYALGLVLLCLGQMGYIGATSPGDAMSWIGRIGHWSATVYFLAACLVIVKQIRDEAADLREALDDLYPPSAEGYRFLVEASPDAIVGLNPEGRILLWNQAAKRMFGYHRRAVLGRKLEDLTGVPLPRPPADGADPASPVQTEFHLGAPDGHGTWLEMSVAYGAVRGGAPVAVVIRDITERKRGEAERERLLAAERAAHATAAAAVQMRDDFLSVAAHELKTPITSLRGFAQLLQRHSHRDGRVDRERLVAGLAQIDRQAERLTVLVNQVLDVSRIEACRLLLNREPADVSVVVAGVVATYRRLRPQREFALQAVEALPATVDTVRLEQVITNLLDNADKFSPPGAPVEIEVGQADGSALRIAVRDHGNGIPPERRARLFERYYQAHEGDWRVGMGLGLFISRQIVEQHGGSIAAEFPGDGGTRFVVLLPVDAGAVDGEGTPE